MGGEGGVIVVVVMVGGDIIGKGSMVVVETTANPGREDGRDNESPGTLVDEV